MILTVVSVIAGFLFALPLAVLSRRYVRLRGGVLGITTAIYTIPSLALFSILVPFTGLGAATVITALTLYSLTILVRNMLAGLIAVPDDVHRGRSGHGVRQRAPAVHRRAAAGAARDSGRAARRDRVDGVPGHDRRTDRHRRARQPHLRGLR